MKPKTDSWNDAQHGERVGRRSLTRAGLGQLTHVVSGALSNLQGSGSNARASAQNRMKALLNQDRALLSHRAFGQASLMDAPDAELAPEVPRKGSQTRSAAQNRMRELLNQDRAMLAFRAREGLDKDEDLDEVLELALKGEPAESSATSASSRMSCVGVTTSFAPVESLSSVCTPGPLSAAEPVHVVQVAPAVVVAPAAPAVVIKVEPAPAPVAKTEESGPDPIRTRGMAKLLALQGYKDRALSIYDELLALEPNNAELRAEADKLRSH